MAENKKTFIFYSDWINMVREMPDKEAGMLLKHILMYVNDENPKTDNILVKMAFAHMMPILKSDLKKWEGIRESRREAGAKGGKANAKQIQANAKQLEAVNVNVNDSNINITTTEAEIDSYITEIAKSDTYLEGFYMRYKLKKGAAARLLETFKQHLKMNPKKHNSFNDFRNHFNNWIQTQEKNNQLEQYKLMSRNRL